MKRKHGILFALLLVCLLGLGAMSAGAAEKNGWSGKYYYKDGKKVTGLQTIGKKQYIFTSKGVLVKNKAPYQLKIKGKKHYYNITAKGVATEWTGTAALAAERIYALKANLSNPTAKKREAALYKAFRWCADKISYRSTGEIDKSSSAADKYGKQVFNTKQGDCVGEAYALMWMAQVLGYSNAKVRVGYVRGTDNSTGEYVYADYAWVVIKINGTNYVFDPMENVRKSNGTLIRDTKGAGKKYSFKYKYGSENALTYCNSKKVVIKK